MRIPNFYVSGQVGQAVSLNNIAIFNETQSAATAGGSSVGSSVWTKRTLNTTIVNNITGCSISSSVITLPAGTYLIEASSPFFNPDSVKIKLRNTTDSTDAILGQNMFNNDSANCNLSAILTGVVTIAGSKNFELQYNCELASATQGLGTNNIGADVSSVYSIIKIVRIA